MTSSESPVIAAGPADLTPLTGHFAIQTYLKKTYLTAVGGGGRITDVIHTDATAARGWETFTVWTDSARQYYAFQTVNGHFLTAVGGGGRITDVIHSDAIRILGWEMFKVVAQVETGTLALQTQKGYFVTAVGGGGHASGETIHTDAVNAREWEFFKLVRVP